MIIEMYFLFENCLKNNFWDSTEQLFSLFSIFWKDPFHEVVLNRECDFLNISGNARGLVLLQIYFFFFPLFQRCEDSDNEEVPSIFKASLFGPDSDTGSVDLVKYEQKDFNFLRVLGKGSFGKVRKLFMWWFLMIVVTCVLKFDLIINVRIFLLRAQLVPWKLLG